MSDRPVQPNDMTLIRIAAGCYWVLALGFGLPCAYAIWYFAQQGEVWTFLGFPTYGHGPFEELGVPTSVSLLSAFLLVCGVELVVGWLLWRGADIRVDPGAGAPAVRVRLLVGLRPAVRPGAGDHPSGARGPGLGARAYGNGLNEP